MQEDDNTQHLLQYTTDIVASHVANNTVALSDLPSLIRNVYDTLTSIQNQKQEVEEKLVPAVSVKRSIQPEYLICLEDGKKLKMLKRHLKTAYNMTPDDYRARWNLPNDYPMVAPNYAKQRSQLAKNIGLGTRAKPE